MKQTEDGFYIAEKDLELRGGGEILGTRQSGFTQFKLAYMSVHQDLLIKARDDVHNILKQDQSLTTPRGQALRVLLYLFEQNEAVKTYLINQAKWKQAESVCSKRGWKFLVLTENELFKTRKRTYAKNKKRA